MNKIDQLLELVRQADFEEIEAARDRVGFSDLGALAAAYATLETWDQKAALINLIQDHLDPRFRSMMLDFLQAPDANWDDTVMLTKAIALCHLDENFDDFMRYYNDRELLAARIQQYLPGSQKKSSSPPQKESPLQNAQNPPAQILGVIALIVGLGMLMITFNNWRTLQKYRGAGITVEARITSKSNQDGNNCIGVSFFDKDLMDGGELYLTEICDFITTDIRSITRRGSHEDVVFLPANPQDQVIFASSLESDQSPGIVIGGGIVIIGLLALGYDWRKNKKTSKQVKM